MRTALHSLTALLVLSAQAFAFECTVCHSKNPAMVKMHKALQGQGCFGCHKMGAKLMGKGQPKDKESLLKRRQSEAVCLPCHNPSSGRKEITHGTDNSADSTR